MLGALTLSASPVLAEPEIKKWNTHHSLGCMLLRECKKDVYKIKAVADIESVFPKIDFSGIEKEMNAMIAEFDRIGIEVFIAEGKYFPPLTRGVYTTDGNKFFLNKDYMYNAEVLLEVSRHEGWHAVQDCMAGSIHNNSIAVVWNDGVVPKGYQLRADIAYSSMPNVIPWEAEALWAGEEPYQTVNGLRACGRTEPMWSVYPPTPLTGEWLIKNGYWDGKTK